MLKRLVQHSRESRNGSAAPRRGGPPVKPRCYFQDHTGLNCVVLNGTMPSMQDMKMLFSSRDRAQIDQVREKLLAAGIRCEVRNFPVNAEVSGTTSYPELWVQANPDYHTASILYASPVRLLQQRSANRTAA